MFEIIKRGLFTGVGIATLTAEKLQELSREVARHADLSESQAKEFEEELSRRAGQARQELEAEIDRRVDHALIQLGLVKAGIKKRAEEAQDELQKFIDERINQALERLGVARTEEVAALTNRIELLEQQVRDSP
jgi:polyhydroxyalkanoate synthesis regulator phasin